MLEYYNDYKYGYKPNLIDMKSQSKRQIRLLHLTRNKVWYYSRHEGLARNILLSVDELP